MELTNQSAFTGNKVWNKEWKKRSKTYFIQEVAMLQQVNKLACYLLDWNSIEYGADQQNRGPKNLCDHIMRVRLAHPSLGEDCVLP